MKRGFVGDGRCVVLVRVIGRVGASAERAIGSCECEFVVAFLCLVGGGRSIHPFVNSAQQSSAVPIDDGTQSGFYDSLADDGPFTSDVRSCDRHRVVKLDETGTMGHLELARRREGPASRKRSDQDLSAAARDRRSPSPEWIPGHAREVKRSALTPGLSPSEERGVVVSQGLKAGLASLVVAGFRFPRTVSGPPH